MTEYYNKRNLFMEPNTNQYGNHMIMTNVHKPSKTKFINIDTKLRDDYDYTQPANFQVDLPERINDIHSIKITNVELPMTFFNISADLGNNCFKVTSGANTEVITIDDNNYDAASLSTEITSKISGTIAAGLTFVINNNKKTVISNKNITISFDVNKHGNNDKFNFKQKLGWLLGFRKTSYDLTTATPINSECTFNLSGPRYLYLAIDEFNKGNQNSFISPLSSSLINKNIIARIALDMQNHPYGSILPANNVNGLLTSDSRSYTGKIDLQKLQIQLLNETGIPMVFNGHDFSFCIEATCE